ncbi:MAG: hypothetical protein QFX33_00660 [Candidatus Nezhaarchaeota archaeon]|nr:hypothetical protein [Candidatus Nezhaarchaeota archaeon]
MGLLMVNENLTMETVREVVDCIAKTLSTGLNRKCGECGEKILCDLLQELVTCGYKMCSDLMHGAVMHTILEVERTERDQGEGGAKPF